eukprot:945103-Pyramimonas_sp.AAC.1
MTETQTKKNAIHGVAVAGAGFGASSPAIAPPVSHAAWDAEVSGPCMLERSQNDPPPSGRLSVTRW